MVSNDGAMKMAKFFISHPAGTPFFRPSQYLKNKDPVGIADAVFVQVGLKGFKKDVYENIRAIQQMVGEDLTIKVKSEKVEEEADTPKATRATKAKKQAKKTKPAVAEKTTLGSLVS